MVAKLFIIYLLKQIQKIENMLKFKTHINNKNNEWITFIHGFGGSSNIWHKQVRDLCRHYNLLFVDLRGHGKSKLVPIDYRIQTFKCL